MAAHDAGRNTARGEPTSPNADTQPIRLPIDDPPASLPGFTMGDELGRGGSSHVYSARELALDREVAVKILKNCDETRRRFAQESRILARLEHPGIVPVYCVGETSGGFPFIAMRLLEGQTFAARLANRAPDGSDLPGFLTTFESVCQTMAYAHSQGIIHRDLKPANVMIGKFGTVTVVDWGLAKDLTRRDRERTPDDTSTLRSAPRAETSDSTQDGTVLGTIQYVPIEQACGDLNAVDERSDVFTLGGILCEILTGKPPYADSTFRAAYRQARKGNLTDAYERLERARGDGKLVELCYACLQASAADRLPNAASVARIIQNILESALSVAQTDLARFFELSLDMFCIAGFDGFFRRINGNFARVLGISEQELLSQPFINFVYEPDRSSTIEAMSQLNEGLPVVRFRNRYVTDGGDLKELEWTAKAIPGEGVIYAVARDVTTFD